MARIWCTFQMPHEQVGPGLYIQIEDAVPGKHWGIVWDLVVAGAIQHNCTTLGRV